MKTTRWDHRLVVRADGKHLIGHAGVVLLRKVADQVGLTAALGAALPAGTGTCGAGRHQRGAVIVHLACAIALGARSVLAAERLSRHWQPLFGPAVSDSTLRRALQEIDETVTARIERARARIRRAAWRLIAARPGGFPWITVAGRRLAGWHVLDLDATIITCTSRKEGAAGTFKGTWGHHPLGAWVANTRECVAMLLRPGNAASNDVQDHQHVLATALRQMPLPVFSKVLIRIDGAGFSHALLDHLQSLTTTRRRVRWVTGWAIHHRDEQALALLPEAAWVDAVTQDGSLHTITSHDGEQVTYQVAEITHLRDLTGWPRGIRLIARRVKPSRRDDKKLTDFEKRTGWRYQIVATNIGDRGLSGAPGTGQAWFLDALYRDHAEVEDRVKATKRTGLDLLPSKSFQLNTAWTLAAQIAADLDAWARLLLLHDQPELAKAEPATIRAKLYHLPARLTTHARRRTLHLSHTWPWATAFTTAWRRAMTLPAVT